MKIRILRETIEKSGDEWIVKSKKGKTLGTHDSKKKAQKQLAAIEASKNEEQLDEMSSVGGGSVQGYAGSPLGDKEDNEKFNESEKQASKLKGKKLAEMFSSSTQTGGLRISIVRGDREHAGHVERAQHQGLRNVMREDDDATIPMDPQVNQAQKPLNTPKPAKDPIEILLDKNGYELKKVLGEGQFGVVVLATEKDEYGGHDFAIKILKSPGSPAAVRELRNYNNISDARDKDPLIAKHFPEVFKIFEAEGRKFIVMEVLEPLQKELKGLFSGVEQALRREMPMSAKTTPISKYSDKDISKRVESLLNDNKTLEQVLGKIKKSLILFSGKFGEGPKAEILKDIDMTMAASSFGNWRGASRESSNQAIDKFQNVILDYIGNSAKMYLTMMDDLKKSGLAQVFITLVCKKIVDLMKKHTPQGEDPKSNSEYLIQSFLELFQEYYREAPAIASGYSQADVGGEKGRLPEGESIYQAIMNLQKTTGLFARDLHSENAMRRPDGDIVIVDVGAFKTQDEIVDMKKGKLRENRIRIRIKR